MKAAYAAKKAAKEADKLKKRQQYVVAKEGKLPVYYYLVIFLQLFYFHSCCSLAAPFRALYAPPLFQVGAHVHSVPGIALLSL